MRNKKVRAVASLIGLAILATACASEPTVEPPTEPPAIDDGSWFAFVTVGADENEELTLGVDLAEMLHGEEARLAAIEAGVIGEDEDLPNDFFIRNEEKKYELLKVRDGTMFTLLDGNDPSNQIEVNGDRLQQVYAGEDIGQPIYGIVPGTAFAMNVTVSGGLVSQGDAVYLP